MKKISYLLSLLLMVTIIAFTGCGDDDDDDATSAGDETLATLAGTWNVTSSTGDVDVSGSSITFDGDGNVTAVTGPLADYVEGASVTVNDESGLITALTITPASTLTYPGDGTVVVNADGTATFTFALEAAAAKTAGVGTYVFTVSK